MIQFVAPANSKSPFWLLSGDPVKETFPPKTESWPIQSKFSCVEVTFILPKYRKQLTGIVFSILEALRLAGHNELDWLSFPPEYSRIDVVVGHGVKLGCQATVIHKFHKCK